MGKREWKVLRADGDTYARVCNWAGAYGLTLAETVAAIVECFDDYQDATDGELDFWLVEAGYIDKLRDGVQYSMFHWNDPEHRELLEGIAHE